MLVAGDEQELRAEPARPVADGTPTALILAIHR
jgi:hypothetical protein